MDYNFAAPIDVNKEAGNTFIGITAGDHPVVINNVEFKPSKNGDYAMAVYNFSVIDGACKGARFKQFMCVNTTVLDETHQNTVKWAKQKLARWAKACGITQIMNPQQLVGLRFIAKIEVAYQGQYKSYDVKGAKALTQQIQAQTNYPQPQFNPNNFGMPQQPTGQAEVPF